MPQIQGIKGEAVPISSGLRTLDNEEDGVLSSFPKGKQNGILLTKDFSLVEELYIIMRPNLT